MERFTLDIKLGNAAMCSSEDIASALRETADKIDGRGLIDCEGRIMDLNGNTVGEFSYEEKED